MNLLLIGGALIIFTCIFLNKVSSRLGIPVLLLFILLGVLLGWYDEVTMPVELRKAHQDNDKAVMEAYGFNWCTMTESDCVAELFKLYQKLTSKSQ